MGKKKWIQARRARDHCPMPMFDYYTIVSLYVLSRSGCRWLRPASRVFCLSLTAVLFGFDPAKCSMQL